mgnify:FL=1
MKRLLLGLFVFVLGVNLVHASSFKVNIVGDSTFDNEVTLYVRVDDLVDFSDTCNGLCGLVGTLKYDTNKIELVSIKALENFDLTQGNNIVIYKSTGVNSGTNVMSMTFKNKSLNDGESTNISFTNITASDGDKDIVTNDVTKKIELKKEEVQEPVVTPEEPSKPVEDKPNKPSNQNKPSSEEQDEEKLSDVNYLSNITLSVGNIEFDKNTLIYDIVVDYDVENILISATLEDNKATLDGDGNHSIKVGENKIVLTVKAEDGTKREYTLNIYREEKQTDIETDENVDQSTQVDAKVQNEFPLIPLILGISALIVIVVIIICFVKKHRKSEK